MPTINISEKKEPFPNSGETEMPVWLTDKFKETIARLNGYRDIIRALTEDVGLHQLKLWEIWAVAKKTCVYPCEKDGFRIWVEGDKITWRKKE